MKKKRQEALEKKLGCIFIRINTSDAKRGYDTDYEVSKIQIFISEFKDNTIKEKDNTIKEKDNKIKELEDEFKKIKPSINKSMSISCQKNLLSNYKKWKRHNQK